MNLTEEELEILDVALSYHIGNLEKRIKELESNPHTDSATLEWVKKRKVKAENLIEKLEGAVKILNERYAELIQEVEVNEEDAWHEELNKGYAQDRI